MIGGSAASVRSALDMAKDGNHVYLVDMPPGIGRCGIPSSAARSDKESDFHPSLWQEVRSQKNIEVFRNAVVEGIEKDTGG